MIEAVTRAAAGRGWTHELVGRDTQRHRYATITVSRFLSSSYRLVSATFELTAEPKAAITYHQTSNFGDGLEALFEAISNEFSEIQWLKKPVHVRPPGQAEASSPTSAAPALLVVSAALRRFHAVAKQLKQRHDGRPPIVIADEYDVQDVLHAILRALFDDVRPEEYSPSYAGGASRLDFLIPAEQLVIEVKFASQRLRDKQLGEELLVDIARYRRHPTCRTLICFVYDPGGFLKNPAGLEADLAISDRDFRVVPVIIST